MITLKEIKKVELKDCKMNNKNSLTKHNLLKLISKMLKLFPILLDK